MPESTILIHQSELVVFVMYTIQHNILSPCEVSFISCQNNTFWSLFWPAIYWTKFSMIRKIVGRHFTIFWGRDNLFQWKYFWKNLYNHIGCELSQTFLISSTQCCQLRSINDKDNAYSRGAEISGHFNTDIRLLVNLGNGGNNMLFFT